MSARGERLLWTMLGLGLAIRVGLAFGTYGLEYDINSLVIVRDTLATEGLDVYGVVNAVQPVLRWPYPPGYFPFILGADSLASATSISFHGLVQSPVIAADLGLAWLVQHYMGIRGVAERVRLLAAGLIALGPLFVMISGYHGQIDSLAILPAVAAVMVWERGREGRALRSGLLIGLGAALKIVPGFLLLALLPTARSKREAAALAGTALAIPLAALAPFILSDPEGVRTLAEYRGGPGMGGLTLALQPGLAELYLLGPPVDLNEPVDLLYHRGVFLNLVVLGALFAFMLRYRPEPVTGAILVWLALWTFGTSFFFHYLIWGLPFIILGRHLLAAALIQAAVTLPAVLFYLGPWESKVLLIPYVPLMLGLWLGLLIFLVAHLRSVARSEGAPAAAT